MGDKDSQVSTIQTEIKSNKRILYVYEVDSLKRKMEYELDIKEIDSMTIYKYRNLIDSTKNISFRFNKVKSYLYFGFEKFNIIEFDNYQTGAFTFDKYVSSEASIDGNGPILFNKNYGVLAWDNGWGNQYYFVTNTNQDDIKLPIFKYNKD